MTYHPTVAVIVPAYNAHATLRECLDSLPRLAYPRERWELIVVDNGSHDDTRAIATGAGVRVVTERKRGSSSARNRGIAETQSEVVAFTDADCVADPDWLANLVAPLQAEGVGVAGGPFLALRKDNAVQCYGEQIHDQQKAICVYQPPYVATANWASPRAVLREVGGFDEELFHGHDADLAWRIVQRGWRLVYQPDAIVRHHNIATWRGLFRQGWQHGYHSVILHRKHAAFLKPFRLSRVSRSRLAGLYSNVYDYALTRSPQARCELTFRGAQLLGKAFASARFGYLDI